MDNPNDSRFFKPKPFTDPVKPSPEPVPPVRPEQSARSTRPVWPTEQAPASYSTEPVLPTPQRAADEQALPDANQMSSEQVSPPVGNSGFDPVTPLPPTGFAQQTFRVGAGTPTQEWTVGQPVKKRRGWGLGKVLLAFVVLASLFGAGLYAGIHNLTGGITPDGTVGAANTVSPSGAGAVDTIASQREQVIARVRPSVVEINVNNGGGHGGLGSGVVIDNKGNIITNNHVVNGAQSVDVVFANGATLPARVVGTAPSDDLAVVKVDPSKIKLTVIPIGDSSKLVVGQDVLAIGNPLGITQTVTAGIVSALDRNVADNSTPDTSVLAHAIQTDAAINPGNSGGALVNMQGELVGIPTLGVIDPEFKVPASGVGFAIQSNRVKYIAPQLIQHGRVQNTGRASLDIRAVSVDASLQQQYNLAANHGVLVVAVTPDGAAAKVGISAGDIIVQINNQKVDNTTSLSDLLLSKKPGDTVSVKFYHNQQLQTAQLQLGELPAA